jgi:hypothetical protein
MKIRFYTYCLGLLFIGNISHAQRLIFPFLRLEAQSNIVVMADFDHLKPCPPEYTNLLSNTNLFSLDEQKKIREVTLKYKNVTTNSGPVGSVFKGFGLRQLKYAELTGATNKLWVACFAYTNSEAQEEVLSYYGQNIVKFRTEAGDGYDAMFRNNFLITYMEYKHGLPDGLFVFAHDPMYPYADEHCAMWAHFTSGKVLGKFIVWQMSPTQDQADFKITDSTTFKIAAEADFKEPFDFLKYQSIPIETSWTEVPTNITNSAQVQK